MLTFFIRNDLSQPIGPDPDTRRETYFCVYPGARPGAVSDHTASMMEYYQNAELAPAYLSEDELLDHLSTSDEFPLNPYPSPIFGP